MKTTLTVMDNKLKNKIIEGKTFNSTDLEKIYEFAALDLLTSSELRNIILILINMIQKKDGTENGS